MASELEDSDIIERAALIVRDYLRAKSHINTERAVLNQQTHIHVSVDA